jgi:DNA-binding IscR family transcriptional regulator
MAGDDITLLQIVETLEGPVCISPALDGEPSRLDNCLSNPVWSELQVKLVDHLNSIRLSVLASQPVPVEMLELVPVGSNGKQE